MKEASENTKENTAKAFAHSINKGKGISLPAHVQPKLTINEPGDIYEQEADAMADKVMSMTEPTAKQQTLFAPPTTYINLNTTGIQQEELQRKENEEELIEQSLFNWQYEHAFDAPPMPPPGNINTNNSNTLLQRKCAHCEEEEKQLQCKEANTGETVAGTATESFVSTINGKGTPLTHEERTFFEPRVGYDFSGVQLYTNTEANESAKNINALAYTHGNNIVFGANQYQPNTDTSKQLLAHELTHVVQQNVGNVNAKLSLQQAESFENLTSKEFACPAFKGIKKLEDCLNDKDRLRPEDSGDAVLKVQTALKNNLTDDELKNNNIELVTDSKYGSNTGKAVMLFKRKFNLGFENFSDVGPGTMQKLDELCGSINPPINPPDPQPTPQPTNSLVHYRFEIKAWIPYNHVPDPEETIHEIGFIVQHPNEDVNDYISEYRGDSHSDYEGSFRVFNVCEFDWNGKQLMNINFPAVTHFGTSHRDFSAVLKPKFSFPSVAKFVHDEDTATTDHAVSTSNVNSQEIDLGMSSPNPLTISPAPNIDADYSFFISQDTFNIETATIRWTTDLMPNHGYRLMRNGKVIKEHIVNSLPSSPLNSAEIFMRLNSKTNGGSDLIEPTEN